MSKKNKKWTSYFKNCKKILDAGCGKGGFTKRLKSKGKEVVSIDKRPSKNAVEADLEEKLPFEDEEFDGISCFHVLEHLSRPDETVEEFRRILKKGGILVLRFPHFMNKTSWNNLEHKRTFAYNSFDFCAGFKILERGYRCIIEDPPPTLKSKIHHKIVNPIANTFPNAFEAFIGYWLGGCEEIYGVLKKK